jgi:hypothetical protein
VAGDGPLGVPEQVLPPDPADDVVADRAAGGERAEQAHQLIGVVDRPLSTVPLVEAAVHAGGAVRDPQLGAEPGEPGEEWGVEDALAPEQRVQQPAVPEGPQPELPTRTAGSRGSRSRIAVSRNTNEVMPSAKRSRLPR